MVFTDVGSLVFVSGSMFSGKSDEILRLAKVYSDASQEVVLFKPDTDTRDEPELVKTRSGRPSRPAIIIPSGEPERIIEESRGKKVVLVEEVHFFAPYLAEVLHYVAHKKKKTVYACGLDRDFRDIPFETSMRVWAYSDESPKLFAICWEADNDCDHKARATQRIMFGTRTPAPYHSERVVVQKNLIAADSVAVPPKFDYTAACYNDLEIPGAPTIEEVIKREKRRHDLLQGIEKQLRDEGY